MRIFVTGGAGFLGRAILRDARTRHPDWRFTIYSRDEGKHAPVRAEFPEHDYVLGDVRDLDPLTNAITGHDVVIHAAAFKYVPQAETQVGQAVTANIMGSQNVATAALRARVERVVGISTDKACLDYHSRVELEDGSTRAIADIVRSKAPVRVRTIVGDRQCVGEVTGWYKNVRAGRHMLRVRYRHGYRHRGRGGGVLVTEDHRIRTTRGWVAAIALTDKDLLVTSEAAPNGRQMALLVGSLLGDGSLRETGAFVRWQRTHDWNDISAQALGSLGATTSPYRNGTTLRLPAAGWGRKMHQTFYNGRKTIPTAFVREVFREEMLAAWYMDDGTAARDKRHSGARPLARFATHSFSKREVKWLADLFTHKGLSATAQRVKINQYGPYYELRLTADGSELLFAKIGRFIVPSMRHKLPNWAPPYDPKSWDLGSPTIFTSPAIVEEEHTIGRDVYCLDVEPSNSFAVGGVVVHNCRAINVYGLTKRVMERLFQESDAVADTRFTTVRYGNVIGSTGSVIPFFLRQAKEGRITLTNPNMTRFWLSVDKAVDLIMRAMRGTGDVGAGTIIVPRLAATDMETVARACAVVAGVPQPKFATIGHRHGEKVDEDLLAPEEVAYSEWDSMERIIHLYSPTAGATDEAARPPGLYTSATPDHWIAVEEMAKMIGEGMET